MSEQPRVLLVEDDKDWLDIYVEYLQEEDYFLDKARSIQQAFGLLQSTIYDAVVTDLKMLGFGNEFGGFGVLQKAREISPATQVIVITAYGTQDIALRATQQGAFDIVYKPPDPERFRITLRNAIQAHRILASRHIPQAPGGAAPMVLTESRPSTGSLPGGLFGLMGNSRGMLATYEKVSYAVHTGFPVLIFGERGTGKSLIAKTIHNNSDRRTRPFAPIAYDDLNRSWQKIVRNLQRFQGGSFLVDGIPDEADDFSMLKDLFAALSTYQIRPITAVSSLQKDSAKLRDAWGIEEEFFETVAQIPIYVPPLRHRKDGDDIPALAGYFLRTLSESMELEPTITVSPEAMKYLVQYDYPYANVRELYEVIQGGLNLLGEDRVLRPEHLLFKGNPITISTPTGAPEVPARVATSYALLVGINHYHHLKHLRSAARDAQDLHQLLSESDIPADNVVLLADEQATKKAVLDRLSWLARSAKPFDKVIIFFSGHGVQIEDATAQEYLCPVDTLLTDPLNTLISSEEFTNAVHQIKAQQLLILLDACHAGGVGRIKQGAAAFKDGISEITYSLLSQGQGRVIIASSKPDEFSWELDGMQNGLFTHYLLEALKGKASRSDGSIWLSNLFSYLSEQLPKHKPQHPFMKSETQDFVVLISYGENVSFRFCLT